VSDKQEAVAEIEILNRKFGLLLYNNIISIIKNGITEEMEDIMREIKHLRWMHDL
jgi:hypothetical protein